MRLAEKKKGRGNRAALAFAVVLRQRGVDIAVYARQLAVGSTARFHADQRYSEFTQCADGTSFGGGEVRQRIDRAGKGQAGLSQLWCGHHRRITAFVGGAI